MKRVITLCLAAFAIAIVGTWNASQPASAQQADEATIVEQIQDEITTACTQGGDACVAKIRDVLARIAGLGLSANAIASIGATIGTIASEHPEIAATITALVEASGLTAVNVGFDSTFSAPAGAAPLAGSPG